MKNHLVLKDEGGRPRSIDTEGMEAVGQFLLTQQRMSWKVIVKFMIEQQRRTWCRNRRLVYEDIPNSDWPKRLSRRTILRYLSELGYDRDSFD